MTAMLSGSSTMSNTSSDSYFPALDDDMSFNSYCIVCDRLITPPKPAAPVEEGTVSQKPKKRAAGTIRVSRTCLVSGNVF
jgi:hypothetical protein